LNKEEQEESDTSQSGNKSTEQKQEYTEEDGK
jgi:hypothetical protein